MASILPIQITATSQKKKTNLLFRMLRFYVITETHINSVHTVYSKKNMAKRNSSGLPVEAATIIAPATNPMIQDSSTSTASSSMPSLRIYTGNIESALTFAKSTQDKHNVLIEIFGN